jgi:hypothetical protein
MAALVLGALGLGAHKIHESREKRKAKKAALVRPLHHVPLLQSSC